MEHTSFAQDDWPEILNTFQNDEEMQKLEF
jgi:hypothetical protein